MPVSSGSDASRYLHAPASAAIVQVRPAAGYAGADGGHSCWPAGPLACRHYQVLSMSIIGETWSALGACEPAGSNRKVTRSPQGVLVTSAMQRSRCMSAR